MSEGGKRGTHAIMSTLKIFFNGKVVLKIMRKSVWVLNFILF